MNFTTKLLLALAVSMAAGVPIALGITGAPQAQSQSPDNSGRLTFEVASIKPADPSNHGMSISVKPGGRYLAKGISVKLLIVNAYGLHDFQISGVPDWADSARYDITAQADQDDSADPVAKRDAQRQRLQYLLADRFNFKSHAGKKELPIYALVVGKGGSKLQSAAHAGTGPIMTMSSGRLTATQISMEMLAANLSNIVGRIVQDRTGLGGDYSLKLEWTPEQEQPASTNPDAPSMFTALQEQLGLKLESQRGPVDILVVDHVEKPSEN